MNQKTSNALFAIKPRRNFSKLREQDSNRYEVRSSSHLFSCGLFDLFNNSLFSFFNGESSISLVFALGGLNDGLSLVNVFNWNLFVFLLWCWVWVLSDFFVDLGVELLNGVNFGSLEVFVPKSELGLVVFFAFVLEFLHVFLDVDTEDSFSVDGGVVFAVGIGAWESLGGVWDVNTTVRSTLHDSEDLVTLGGVNKTDVQDSLEWLSLFIVFNFIADIVVSTVDLSNTLVQSVKLSLLKESSGKEETGGVGYRQSMI